MKYWRECAPCPEPSELLGEFCYGGIDLSSVQDLAAYALIFPPSDRRAFWDLLIWHFCPQETIYQRSRADRVPYDVWARDKVLTPTPGNSIDYDEIEKVIMRTKQVYKIGAVGYDRWAATQIVQHLTEANVKMTPVGMGYGSLGAPTKELLKLILSGTFRHGNNPILNWEAENIATVEDPAGNIKPAKNASGDKIDGFIAILCALFCSMNFGDRPKKSVYQSRGATVIDGSTKVQESAVTK
jgi:phage terminase large subunit-like protein